MEKEITIEDLIDLHEQGKTHKEISDETGISNTTVNRRLSLYGLINNRQNVTKEEIIDLLSQGLRPTQAAKKLGISVQVVNYYADRLEKSPPDPEQVRILHSVGLTNIGIAKLLQTTCRAVDEVLNSLGLKDNSEYLKELLSMEPEEAIRVSMEDLRKKREEAAFQNFQKNEEEVPCF